MLLNHYSHHERKITHITLHEIKSSNSRAIAGDHYTQSATATGKFSSEATTAEDEPKASEDDPKVSEDDTKA